MAALKDITVRATCRPHPDPLANNERVCTRCGIHYRISKNAAWAALKFCIDCRPEARELGWLPPHGLSGNQHARKKVS